MFENQSELIDNEENVSHETLDQATDDVASDAESEQPEALDLSTVELVKLGERVLKRDELEKGFMLQQDYTRKTQEIARERKYYDNLEVDLENVKRNPALADQFKQVYPEKFWKLLRFAVNEDGRQQATKTHDPRMVNGNAKGKLDPVVTELDKRLKAIEEMNDKAQMEKYEQQVDLVMTKFGNKYPLSVPNGDDSMVLTLAQKVLQSNRELDEKTWEKIFQAAHKHHEAAYQNYYKQRAELAKKTNLRGKDSAGGGGVPGSGPKLPRNIKEATQALIEDLGNPSARRRI